MLNLRFEMNLSTILLIDPNSSSLQEELLDMKIRVFASCNQFFDNRMKVVLLVLFIQTVGYVYRLKCA